MKAEKIEKEIEMIKERNRRVELDKEWETSFFRKVLIAVLTYLVVVVFMWEIGVEDFFLNAIIPTMGFVLSTFSLSWVKNWWIGDKKYR